MKTSTILILAAIALYLYFDYKKKQEAAGVTPGGKLINIVPTKAPLFKVSVRQ